MSTTACNRILSLGCVLTRLALCWFRIGFIHPDLGIGGAERLVVYVVVEPEVETAGLEREIARRIGARLNPLFKLHELVPVEALPRTASNKIMRRSLRDAYRAGRRGTKD